MDLNIPYFVYCETGSFPGIEQPLNVISNLAFFICAFLIWQDDKGRGTSLTLIAALMVVYGFCSMLWHATEKHVTLALEIGSMAAMGGVLATVLANQILRWTPLNSVMMGIIIVLSTFVGRDLGFPLLLQNGGAFLPMLVFLTALAFIRLHGGATVPAKYLLASGYLLFLGLVFGTLDWPLCRQASYGLHFAWHICLALAVYCAIESVHKNHIAPEETED